MLHLAFKKYLLLTKKFLSLQNKISNPHLLVFFHSSDRAKGGNVNKTALFYGEGLEC